MCGIKINVVDRDIIFRRADIFLHTELSSKAKPVALKKVLDRATKRCALLDARQWNEGKSILWENVKCLESKGSSPPT